MQEIVMSFDPDGSIEFTRHKALDGFFGGRGTMNRVTDIQKLPDEPLYFIKWLLGPFAGRRHGVEQHSAIFQPDQIGVKCQIGTAEQLLLFYSYDDAVNYEIFALNEMRRSGVVFDAAIPGV